MKELTKINEEISEYHDKLEQLYRERQDCYLSQFPLEEGNYYEIEEGSYIRANTISVRYGNTGDTGRETDFVVTIWGPVIQYNNGIYKNESYFSFDEYNYLDILGRDLRTKVRKLSKEEFIEVFNKMHAEMKEKFDSFLA